MTNLLRVCGWASRWKNYAKISPRLEKLQIGIVAAFWTQHWPLSRVFCATLYLLKEIHNAIAGLWWNSGWRQSVGSVLGFRLSNAATRARLAAPWEWGPFVIRMIRLILQRSAHYVVDWLSISPPLSPHIGLLYVQETGLAKYSRYRTVRTIREVRNMDVWKSLFHQNH